MDFETDVKIDESALDIEWLEQAPLALRYAERLKVLRRRVRALEEKKKTVRSELILQANADPKGCIGKDRPNAADIEAFYRTQDEYKDVAQQLLDAQEELDFMELAYREISDTRKRALENLVKLHGQSYFAGPRVPRDLTAEREEREARQKRADEAVAKATTRRRRKA